MILCNYILLFIWNFNYNCNVNCSFHILLISLLQQVRYITGLPRKPLVCLARTRARAGLAPEPSSVVFVGRVRPRNLSLRGYSTTPRTVVHDASLPERTSRVYFVLNRTKTLLTHVEHHHKPGLLRATSIILTQI